MAGFAYLVCSRGFAELVECHFRRTDRSYRNQRHDAFEMLPITSDTGPQSNDIATVRLWCPCSRGNKGRPAAWFQHSKGPLRNISADGIEHRVASTAGKRMSKTSDPKVEHTSTVAASNIGVGFICFSAVFARDQNTNTKATESKNAANQSGSVRNVLQVATSPDFKPVMNQRVRCPEVPCVNA